MEFASLRYKVPLHCNIPQVNLTRWYPDLSPTGEVRSGDRVRTVWCGLQGTVEKLRRGYQDHEGGMYERGGLLR